MNVELDKAIRLYDFITMGELVAYDALNRNESCGMFLSECDYYTEKEIQKFKQVTASYRNLSQNAYRKAVADYLFSQKQYGKALQKYEKLTEEGDVYKRQAFR